jgi:hypothetical protein
MNLLGHINRRNVIKFTRFGDWHLSPSSDKTYPALPNRTIPYLQTTAAPINQTAECEASLNCKTSSLVRLSHFSLRSAKLQLVNRASKVNKVEFMLTGLLSWLKSFPLSDLGKFLLVEGPHHQVNCPQRKEL